MTGTYKKYYVNLINTEFLTCGNLNAFFCIYSVLVKKILTLLHISQPCLPLVRKTYRGGVQTGVGAILPLYVVGRVNVGRCVGGVVWGRCMAGLLGWVGWVKEMVGVGSGGKGKNFLKSAISKTVKNILKIFSNREIKNAIA